MYLTCPLCRDEWILTTRICVSCDKIRHYMEIYSQQKILEILDKVLVVQQHKENIVKNIEKKTLEIVKNEKYVAGIDSNDYEKPSTRNQKNNKA